MQCLHFYVSWQLWGDEAVTYSQSKWAGTLGHGEHLSLRSCASGSVAALKDNVASLDTTVVGVMSLYCSVGNPRGPWAALSLVRGRRLKLFLAPPVVNASVTPTPKPLVLLLLSRWPFVTSQQPRTHTAHCSHLPLLWTNSFMAILWRRVLAGGTGSLTARRLYHTEEVKPEPSGLTPAIWSPLF